MADADASAAFELEEGSLSEGLDGIAAKFAAIATSINAGFAGANVQLARTAVSAQAIGASSPAVTGFSRGLATAATTAGLVTTGLSGVVMVVSRIAPLVRFIPNALGAWVAPVKAAVAEHQKLIAVLGVVRGGVQAITGRMTVWNAAFLALNAHGAGASKTMAVLGSAGALAGSKIIAAMRGAVGAIASIGSGVGRAAGRVGGLGSAFNGLGRSASTIGMVMSPMLGMAIALGPIGAAAIGVAAGFSAVKKSIAGAGEMQTLTAGFVTLLGSADAAQARMAELSRFAASTPFEIPQVVRASKVLETLTKGALSTGAGLRMVGDLASISGQPFEDLSVHVGRLYDGLMNGRPVGEAMMRLQELGLMSSDTRGRIEDLQKSGAKGGDVWKVAATDRMRFSGEMNRQSNTWEGVMSNIHDSIGSIFRAFGAPIVSSLTPFMQRMQSWLQSLVAWAARAGQIFAGWSATIAQIFADGQMGSALLLVGKIAFTEAVNFLLGGLVGVGRAFGSIIAGAIKVVLTLLAAATTADFWKGLGNALLSAAQMMIALLLEGVAQVLDAMRDVPGIGDSAGRAADQARSDSGGFADAAAANAAAAGNQLSPLFTQLDRDMRATLAAVGKSFSEGRASVGSVFDSSGDKEALSKLLQSAWAKAKTDIAATAKVAQTGGLPPPAKTDATTGEKGGAQVGALQKLGLGGGSGPRDPVVAATNSVCGAVEMQTKAINEQTKVLLTFRRSGGQLVFG